MSVQKYFSILGSKPLGVWSPEAESYGPQHDLGKQHLPCGVPGKIIIKGFSFYDTSKYFPFYRDVLLIWRHWHSLRNLLRRTLLRLKMNLKGSSTKPVRSGRMWCLHLLANWDFFVISLSTINRQPSDYYIKKT